MRSFLPEGVAIEMGMYLEEGRGALYLRGWVSKWGCRENWREEKKAGKKRVEERRGGEKVGEEKMTREKR